MTTIAMVRGTTYTEATAIVEAIHFCMPFVSKEETRYYLNGVWLIENGAHLWAIATDGHRMAYTAIAPASGRNRRGRLTKDVLGVIKKATSSRTKRYTAKITLDLDIMSITVNGSSHKLIEDLGLCDLFRVMPSTKTACFELPTLDTIEALEPMSNKGVVFEAIANPDSPSLTACCEFNTGRARTWLKNTGRARTWLKATFDAEVYESIRIGLNAQYVREALKVFNSTSVCLDADPDYPARPVRIHCGSRDTHGVILMPLRI